MPDEKDDLTSTDDLIKRMDQLNQKMEEQANQRHQVNNRLMRWLDKQHGSMEQTHGAVDRTMAGLRSMQEAVVEHDKRLAVLSSQVTELDHILRGVGGNNGMRADLKDIRARMRWLELRVFALCALVGGGAFGLSKLI
ncbi:MAG: hypothetical protein ACREIA_24215 [Opitutaceae bacterium]